MENSTKLALYDECIKKGYGVSWLAEQMGASACKVKGWLKSQGLEQPYHKSRLTKAEHARRLEVYKLGLTDPESAKLLGLPYNTYRGWRSLVSNLPPSNPKNCKPQSADFVALQPEGHRKKMRHFIGLLCELSDRQGEAPKGKSWLCDLVKEYRRQFGGGQDVPTERHNPRLSA